MYRNREPQCAKSDDMTKALDGSDRYGARMRPSWRSVEAEVLPTMIGTNGGRLEASNALFRVVSCFTRHVGGNEIPYLDSIL